MIGYFFLGLCFLVGLLLLAKWYTSADPKTLAKTVPRVAIVIGVVLLVIIILTGRAGLLLAFAPLLLMFFARFRALKQRFRAAMGPQPGQRSEVVTRFFRMTLDHDSGDLAGEILDGSFAGKDVDELTREELLELWRETVVDAQSASVLESYLNRRFGPEWQDDLGPGDAGFTGGGDSRGGRDSGRRSGWGSSGTGGRQSSSDTAGGAMTRQQAYDILGLEQDASKEEIREAHRRLLQKIHPDHGGSNFLAAQINRAKDLLLGD